MLKCLYKSKVKANPSRDYVQGLKRMLLVAERQLSLGNFETTFATLSVLD